ncbi:putative O-methyltransferase [Xylaria bambusicola]|uniref:putative O-methyltransferase n=1 Tax=Xylaria bambusicola TaxID=326684 RepID=UPI0020084A53|nr:putative O-methyltransferase [Xylaria bambusicola]KAI0521562.1 putative O-methyltransferase [Xylaria bambusicola]
MASRIDHLAATISANTNAITTYLDQNNLPHPSFDADGPITLNLSSQVERARSAAINALQELLDLLQGPIACMIPNYNGTSLQVISRHDIASKVPMEGAISFAELAQATDLHVNDLRRILRYAMCYHRLFKEPEEGFVAHSAGSKKLATDKIVRAGLGQSFDEFYGSFARTADALDTFKDGEPNHTGFALAHNTDKTMFDYLRTHPLKADQFSKAMRFYSAGVPGYSESLLVEGYDWESLGAVTVVDVGGADGYVSRALSKAHPKLNMVVEDLPDIVDAADRVGSTDRIRYQAYDFFSTQPIAGADIYLFRWVFHDWPDHYVIQILRAQVPALHQGSRIVVNESLSVPPRSLPLTLRRDICFIDLLMLTTNNSRLRTMAEWQDLFTAADSRFGTVRRISGEGAALAILEVAWEGE